MFTVIDQGVNHIDICFFFLALGSNFDMIFTRKNTKDMVLLNDEINIPTMRAVTVAMFVKADSHFTTGTLFTYSVPGSPTDILSISFNALHIEVILKGTVVKAPFKLLDDSWHFVGVVWNAMNNSTLSIYIDGLAIETVHDVLAPEETLTGGGWIVLGQQYFADSVVPAKLSQSFVGTIHQVNMWNVAAMADHMWNAAHNCTWPIGGSVRAWISFLSGIKGQIQRRFPTKCKGMLERAFYGSIILALRQLSILILAMAPDRTPRALGGKGLSFFYRETS